MNFGVDIKEYEGKVIGMYGGKFSPMHIAHLSCIMKAQSMVDILFVVVGFDEEYDKNLYVDSKLEYMTARERERIISRELRNFPNIRVFSQRERRSEDYMNDYYVTLATQSIIKRCGGKIDYVFSSENEYEPYFNKYYPNSKHIVLDNDREEFDISATKIRSEGVYKHWNLLPKATQEHFVKRVAICGIESAGKTHLLKMLSSYLNTTHLEEYGRLYYDELNSYTDVASINDYAEIAVGHVHQMNLAARDANKVLLVDTDLIYTQYFHNREYDFGDPTLDTMIEENLEKIDTYIYIEPHNYHELDGTRRPVDEEARKEYNQMLKNIYKSYGKNIIIVDEVDRNKRFSECLKIIENIIK